MPSPKIQIVRTTEMRLAKMHHDYKYSPRREFSREHVTSFP